MPNTPKKGKCDKMKRTRKENNTTLKAVCKSKKVRTPTSTESRGIHGARVTTPSAYMSVPSPEPPPPPPPSYSSDDNATYTTLAPVADAISPSPLQNDDDNNDDVFDDVFDDDDDDVIDDDTNDDDTNDDDDDDDDDDNDTNDTNDTNDDEPEVVIPVVPKTFTEIDTQVETLADLIAIGKLYEDEAYHTKLYSVNVEGLHKMIPALEEFGQLVGMENIKKQVVDQVIYLSGKSNHQQFASTSACSPETNPAASKSPEQTLLETLIAGISKPKTSCTQYKMSDSVTEEDNNFDMFHTVIYGPPGVGKTAFAKVLARIFLSLSITETDTFRIARRSDLIGEYVGHTATKTQKIIDESMGGVLFIDEIYSLGNGGSTGEKTDSFSTECINTLNQNLTEHKGKFICIIAGYKHETEKYFFGLNPGLRRRFSFYYTIEGYTWEELTSIFMYKIRKLRHWQAHPSLAHTLQQSAFLQDKTDHFPHYAGDMETLLLNTKIAHCKRVFGKAEELQRVIVLDDVKEGYARFGLQKKEDVDKKRREMEAMQHLYV